MVHYSGPRRIHYNRAIVMDLITEKSEVPKYGNADVLILKEG